MDCPYAYYITIHNSDWTEMDETHRIAMIADALMSIPPDAADEGKINQFDAKYHSVMLRTLGPDFMDKPDLPNLLKDNVKWVI
jgi:hypothetical protein